MPTGFDYLRQTRARYKPKTPNAALKAFAARILPIHAFINMGTSVKPLDEEPYDLDDIERVLARENLDLQTNLLLMRLFERMVKNEDAEIALFAAESMNLIENRYNKSIRAMKEKITVREDDNVAISELCRLYYELAQVYEPVQSIRNFYLRESHAYLVKLIEGHAAGREDIGRLINIFIRFGDYDKAMAVADRYGDANDAYFLWLKAEIEFRRRNFIGVFQICTWLMQRKDQLDETEQDLLSYWLGH